MSEIDLLVSVLPEDADLWTKTIFKGRKCTVTASGVSGDQPSIRLSLLSNPASVTVQYLTDIAEDYSAPFSAQLTTRHSSDIRFTLRFSPKGKSIRTYQELPVLVSEFVHLQQILKVGGRTAQRSARIEANLREVLDRTIPLPWEYQDIYAKRHKAWKLITPVAS